MTHTGYILLVPPTASSQRPKEKRTAQRQKLTTSFSQSTTRANDVHGRCARCKLCWRFPQRVDACRRCRSRREHRKVNEPPDAIVAWSWESDGPPDMFHTLSVRNLRAGTEACTFAIYERQRNWRNVASSMARLSVCVFLCPRGHFTRSTYVVVGTVFRHSGCYSGVFRIG